MGKVKSKAKTNKNVNSFFLHSLDRLQKRSYQALIAPSQAPMMPIARLEQGMLSLRQDPSKYVIQSVRHVHLKEDQQ